jgi:hypothetical protein
MPIEKTIYENGSEPEYTIDDFARVEYLKDGMVRICVASEWRGGLRVDYSVRVNKTKLAELGRACLVIAAETHNAEQFDFVLQTAH